VKLSPRRAERLEAVTMDMAQGYISAVLAPSRVEAEGDA